jgi:hypothetical protein
MSSPADGYFSDSVPAENPAAMWHIAGDYSIERDETHARAATLASTRSGTWQSQLIRGR